MNKKIFWIRFAIYVLFGLIVPVVFLVWRFKLFQKISSISIGGWGVVAILIVFFFIIKMLKYIKKGLPFSFGTQIISGYLKVVIPLFVSVLIINALKGCINELVQFLVVLTACQAIAVPANPFPKWIHDNNLEQQENQTRRIFESLGIIKPKK